MSGSLLNILVPMSRKSYDVQNCQLVLEIVQAGVSSIMAKGFIYILINPAMPGLVKIGRTSGTSEDRAAELSAVTGLPTPFVVAYDWITYDCVVAEEEVHACLEAMRYSKDREFFRIPLKEAIAIVSEICEKFDPRLVDEDTNIMRRRPEDGSFSATFSCERCRQKYSITIAYPENDVVCPSCNKS
jgi:hypothetical protein